MDKGFFASLFDTSFSSLITPKIIRVVYIIALVAIGLFSLLMFANMAAADQAALGLIIAPIAFLLYVIVTRIWLELVIIVFRIGEDVRRIADRQAPGGSTRPPTVI